jgi:hypothetical protein
VESTPVLRQIVTSFLEEKGWPYAELPDGSLRLTFAGVSGQFDCRAAIDEDRSTVTFFALFPGPVPGDRAGAVLELLNRANLNLVIGNFEYDPGPGQVRCRTSINVDDDRLTPALLSHVVYASLLAMDRYLPAFAAATGDSGAEPKAPPPPVSG